MPRLIVLALALALMLLAPAARAEALRALLIGVGAYPNLTGADLRGPVNDVRLMAEVLIGRGVAPSDITVLTTDPAGLPAGVATGLPTRAAILGGLDALARAAGPGQTVVVHYSGHGSQAPDDNGDEMGGMDEILLPMDVAGWRGSAGGVANAIVDDEMQGRMQAILDTGARLVGIIDACHSATGFRALGAPGVARTLDPAALGVPANAGPAPAGTANPPLAGEFVFLYAAQSDQRAFEYPLEQGTDPPAWYGAFTRQLAGVLRAAPQATWAQVLAEVSGTMRQGSAVQTPDGEGPLLAAPIPGAVAGGRRLALADGRVQAGLLWGLTEGSVVDVYPAATAAAPVARARLVRLRADTAELEAAPGTSLPAAGAVEVVAPAPPPPLRLMRPAAGGDWDGLLAAAVAAGLAEWSVASADLVPVVTPEGALALAGADGVLDPAGPGSSPRIAPGAGAAGRLNALLADAGHALRLRRALAGAAGAARGVMLAAAPLSLAVERRPGRPAAAGGCGAAGPGAPADPADGVAHCDELWLTLTNRSTETQDVTVLYQDRSFRLSALYPVRGLSNRLARGEAARIGLRIDAPDGLAGQEDIVVIAVAAQDGARRTDLTHLAEAAQTRDAAPGLGRALAALLDPETARSFSPPALSPFSVLRQSVRITPPTRP